jgi:cobalamin biosynthesis protein CobD/CbiB
MDLVLLHGLNAARTAEGGAMMFAMVLLTITLVNFASLCLDVPVVLTFILSAFLLIVLIDAFFLTSSASCDFSPHYHPRFMTVY